MTRHDGTLPSYLGSLRASANSELAGDFLNSSSWQGTLDDHRPEIDSVPLYLHEQISIQAERTPGRVAVVSGSRQLTYSELESRSNKLAHYLRTLGAGLETRVGILVDRGVEMVVALLGILKAGAAYVPLAASLPRERIAGMLKTAGVGMMLTEQAYRNLFPEGIRVVSLEQEADEIATCSSMEPSALVTAENLAYVIYTSGSTGEPKGVQISHRNLINIADCLLRKLALTPDDVVLALTTITFDISVLELYVPLMAGAQIVVIDEKGARDPAQIAKTLSQHKVTVMQATPSTWSMLIEDGWNGQADLRAVSGGEPLFPALARQILGRTRSLWNLYGPTETTVWSTGCEFRSAEPPISIGLPLANTQIHILDEDLQPAPQGVTGEIYVSGVGVARGYINRADLTSERFLPDPFSAMPGGRMYRTGDLGRVLDNGELECLGRTDHQVKIRGHRIELGEIESVLRVHPDVADAVVTIWDHDGDKQLAGYIVPRSGEVAPNDLIEHLKARLPVNMVPKIFIALTHLPLNLNGKVDRRALPPPTLEKIKVGANYVAPESALEEVMVNIWSEVLGIERLGAADNFFNLGGHSLLATQIISRLRAAFQQDFEMDLLFDNPTVKALCAAIQSLDLQPGRIEEVAAMLQLVNQMSAEEFVNFQENE